MLHNLLLIKTFFLNYMYILVAMFTFSVTQKLAAFQIPQKFAILRSPTNLLSSVATQTRSWASGGGCGDEWRPRFGEWEAAAEPPRFGGWPPPTNWMTLVVQELSRCSPSSFSEIFWSTWRQQRYKYFTNTQYAFVIKFFLNFQ